MITSVSGCLSLLAIGNRAACASIVDNNGLDLIIALLKTSAPGVALKVCANVSCIWLPQPPLTLLCCTAFPMLCSCPAPT